jgi:hypothetical protein
MRDRAQRFGIAVLLMALVRALSALALWRADYYDLRQSLWKSRTELSLEARLISRESRRDSGV